MVVPVAEAIGIQAQARGRADLDEGQGSVELVENREKRCGSTRFVGLGGPCQCGFLHCGPVFQHPLAERGVVGERRADMSRSCEDEVGLSLALREVVDHVQHRWIVGDVCGQRLVGGGETVRFEA